LSNTGYYRGGPGGGGGGGNPGGSGGGSGPGGGGGGGDGGFNIGDSNKQIMLLLLRLQQDTNNVLTRLSYLETTVMAIQSNLQINRLENSIQLNNHNNNNNNNNSNNQLGSAFSVVHGNGNGNLVSNNSKGRSFLDHLIRNVDWKTVAIAIIWPFIIRLAFYFLKKVRLVM
jgi:hypothetical protein